MSVSEGQYKLKRLLKKVFPQFCFEEEYCIGEGLRLDFFCKKLSLAFEFDGAQHEDFSLFFHKDKDAFEQQKQRDKRKERWARLNDVTLIRVRKEDLTEQILKNKIYEAFEES